VLSHCRGEASRQLHDAVSQLAGDADDSLQCSLEATRRLALVAFRKSEQGLSQCPADRLAAMVLDAYAQGLGPGFWRC
jgi:hypothetical protein